MTARPPRRPRAGRTRLAYHGLDLARFPAAPQTAPRATGKRGAAQAALRRRLVAKKGHDDLFAALGALPVRLHWHLDLIGGGELRAELERLVRERELTARVTFHGALPQPAIIAAMREADLFVLPTKPAEGGDRDGLPNVLMEAASQELPILAHRLCGHAEFITDGTHGILVPPNEQGAGGGDDGPVRRSRQASPSRTRARERGSYRISGGGGHRPDRRCLPVRAGSPCPPARTRVRILIAVTHLLGAGHLTRAAALARAFAAAGHETVLVSGGHPAPLVRLDGVRLVQLPPLRIEGFDFGR